MANGDIKIYRGALVQTVNDEVINQNIPIREVGGSESSFKLVSAEMNIKSNVAANWTDAVNISVRGVINEGRQTAGETLGIDDPLTLCTWYLAIMSVALSTSALVFDPTFKYVPAFDQVFNSDFMNIGFETVGTGVINILRYRVVLEEIAFSELKAVQQMYS